MAALTLAQPHWECVSKQLQQLLEVVGRQPFSQRFYLAGGTALALQLGHRISVDLDFFASDDDLLDEQRHEIINTLQPHLTFEIVHDVIGSLLLNVGGVALGFFSYRYPLLELPLLAAQVALAGPVDIGLMKLDAIASRGARKDFYDLYFIAQIVSLDTLLERSVEKYSGHQDFAMQTLAALTNFTVADKHPPLQTMPSIEWETVRAFCRAEVRRIGYRWFEDESES
jgi:predicted nucleotidyltransferase component of viral defense system